MTANVGGMDKGIRAILGVVLLAYGIITGHWSGFIGAVLLGTAALSFCPAYTLIGVNTKK